MAEFKKVDTPSKARGFVSPMLARYLEEDDSRQAFRAGQQDSQSSKSEPRKIQMENVAGKVEQRKGRTEGGRFE